MRGLKTAPSLFGILRRNGIKGRESNCDRTTGYREHIVLRLCFEAKHGAADDLRRRGCTLLLRQRRIGKHSQLKGLSGG